MRRLAWFALIAALSAPAIAKGKDPRPPGPEQRAAIERALKDQGFVRWSGIRTDDDGPEVDSAWDGQGRIVIGSRGTKNTCPMGILCSMVIPSPACST